MVTKLLSMLGLARRAGKLESGFDAAVIAAREGKAALLLAARDISEKTFQNLRYEAEKAGIPVVRIPADIEETSRGSPKRCTRWWKTVSVRRRNAFYDDKIQSS